MRLKRRTAAFVLSCLFIAAFLLAHLRVHATLIDDAFITYRYSANFANGKGLVYNEGERVLGTTTPGYALLLGVIGRFSGIQAIPRISQVIGAIGHLVFGVCSAWLAQRITGNSLSSTVIFGIVLLSPQTLYSSLAGMESSLFLALIGGGFVALALKRWYLAAAVIGLSPWFRPEGIFVILLVLLVLAYTIINERDDYSLTRKTFLATVTILVLPGLVEVIFLLIYYGSPIPQSIIAKQAGLYPLKLSESAYYVLVDQLFALLPLNFSLSPLIAPVFTLMKILVLVFIFVPAIVLGGLWLTRRGFPYLMFGPLLGIFVFFYATSRTNIFPHYIAHFEALLKALLFAGLFSTLEWATARWQRLIRIRPALTIGIGILILFPGIYYYPIRSIWMGEIDSRDPAIPQEVERQRIYRNLAVRLEPLLPDHTVVVLPEIGELGFYLPKVYVLDAAGLVSPDVVSYFPVPADQRPNAGTGVIPPQLIRDYLPDLLIFLEVFGRYGILDDPWFWAHYEPVITWCGDWLPWESKALYVFSRKDFSSQLVLPAEAEQSCVSPMLASE
mgnify:CR=1 FL=1